MGLQYSKDCIVSYFDSDTVGTMKLTSIFQKALELSGEHSSLLGRSDKYLMEEYGVAWVVLEYDMQVNRLPQYEEKFVITTEATSYNKFFCYRDFYFKDTDGNILLTIHSTWCMMNLAERKIASITDDIVLPYESDKLNKLVRGYKYSELSGDISEKDYTIKYWDLDLNGHVNNVRYLDWIIDSLDRSFLEKHEPAEFHLKYIKEIQYGTLVHSIMEKDNLTTNHEIISSEQNAQASIVWKEKYEV